MRGLDNSVLARLLATLSICLAARSALAQASGSPATDPAANAPAPNASASGAPATGGSASSPSIAEFLGALNENVVTGPSRAAETSTVAPATTTTVHADDLRRYGMRTLNDAIRFLSVGAFTLAPNTAAGLQTSAVGARGLIVGGDQGTHFLLVLDGDAETAPSVDYLAAIPLEMIDSIEVILGAGSVLYGSGAMLAVINVTTKEARHFSGLRVVGQAGASPALNAQGNIKNFKPNEWGTSPRAAIGFGKQFTFRGLRGEVTSETEYASDTMPHFDLALQSQPGSAAWGGGAEEHLTLEEAVTNYTRVKLGRFSASVRAAHGSYPQAAYLTTPTNQSDWSASRIRLNGRYDFDLSERLSGFARAWGGGSTVEGIAVLPANDRGGTCPPPGSASTSRCAQHQDIAYSGGGVELQGTYDLAGNSRYPLAMGLAAEYSHSGNFSHLEDLATGQSYGTSGGYLGTQTTLAAYALERARFLDWLSVNAGVRYDRTAISADGFPTPPSSNPITTSPFPSFSADNISPRVSLILMPFELTSIYLTGGTAFRSPNIFEKYITSGDLTWSPDLKGETLQSGEIGIRQRVGTHRAMLAGFVQEADGLIGIGWAGGTNKVQFQNLGKMTSWGFNLGIEGDTAAERFKYGASFTWAKSRQTLGRPDASTYLPVYRQYIDKYGAASIEKAEIVGAPEISANARASYDLAGDLPVLALAAVVYGPRLTQNGLSSVLPQGSYPAFGYAWPSNLDPMRTDPQVELRAAVTGPLGSLRNWRYTVMGNYVTAPFTPVSVGPRPGGNVSTSAYLPGIGTGQSPERASGQLFPNNRLTVMVGLEVQIDP